MGGFCSKGGREKSAKQLEEETPPPSPLPPKVPEVEVIQPSADAHAIIYKSEVESRHKEIRSMTAAKPVCGLFVENNFKPGYCRECKHPKNLHADPYADILDDLADPAEEVQEEVPQDQAPQD